ncbi:MAG: BrnT family toxin [Deltaproteobacteria bacterium]|nr:BrnT family toxin [Deltaproteobacteria bacterium]
MYLWDEGKNQNNKAKHGISFEEARDSLFEGKNVLASGVAYEKGETRNAVIGKHAGKYYAGIFTLTSEGGRIISVRRARDEEEKQAKEKGV